MSKIIGTIVVDTQRCKGCSLCVAACNKDVICMAKKVNANGYPYVMIKNADNCVGCAACAIVCPDGCISVYRKKLEDK